MLEEILTERVFRFGGVVLLCLICTQIAVSQFTAPDEETFTFMVLGDTSYKAPLDYPAYRSLIRSINRAEPAFSIHIGDTKPGHGTCNERRQRKARSFFERFENPLIYTPGDNEWTDCGRSHTREDPIASLGYIRKVFFAKSQSLGKNPRPLTRQSDIHPYSQMSENAYWVHRGIHFATIHVVGSNNNLKTRDPVAMAEYRGRNAANLVWIRRLFERARHENARGVAIAFHAQMLKRDPAGTGFEDTVVALQHEAASFSRPILLIHGDTHHYTVDRPLDRWFSDRFASGTFDHVVRLETFGYPHQKAVEVEVQLNSKQVFTIAPFDPPYSDCTFVPLCILFGSE